MANQIKQLPAPRFHIMSQDEIIYSRIRIDAMQRHFEAENALDIALNEARQAEADLDKILLYPDRAVRDFQEWEEMKTRLGF